MTDPIEPQVGEYVIRRGQSADLPAVIRLTELWAKEPSTTGHYPVNFAADLQKRLGSYFWVATSTGHLVGFVLGSLNTAGSQEMHYQVLRNGEDHLNLDQLYVHPNHRGRGVGSALLAQLLAEAAAQGIHRQLLLSENATCDWQRTLRFYERHGFRPWFFTMFTGPSTQEETPDPPNGPT